MTGWGTARLSCAPPRAVGLRVDQLAPSDHALGKDPRAQPPPVDGARHDALLREVLEVLAGLAEPRADHAHRAHPELAIDQVVERNAGRCDVAAGLSHGGLDPQPGAPRGLGAAAERRGPPRPAPRHPPAAPARPPRGEARTAERGGAPRTPPRP